MSESYLPFVKGKFYVLRNGAKAECISTTINDKPDAFGYRVLLQWNNPLYGETWGARFSDGCCYKNGEESPNDVVGPWVNYVYCNVYLQKVDCEWDSAIEKCNDLARNIKFYTRLGVLKRNQDTNEVTYIPVTQ